MTNYYPVRLKKSFMKYRYSDRINKQQIQKDITISPGILLESVTVTRDFAIKKKNVSC